MAHKVAKMKMGNPLGQNRQMDKKNGGMEAKNGQRPQKISTNGKQHEWCEWVWH